MKKVIVAVAVIVLILVVVSLMFFRRTPFAYSGVIEAIQVDTSSRLTGQVIKNYFDEGNDIKKGDLLAELDCKDVNIALDLADKEYKRAAQLLKSTAGSKADYDRAKYQYDNAVLQQSWCKITAPSDGRILYRYLEEGDLAVPGRKLFTSADMREMDVWFYVPHDELANLRVNQKVQGILPEVNRTFEGVIIVVNDEAEFTPKNVQTRSERTRLVFGIKTRFKNDAGFTLKPGMTMEIRIK